MSAGALSRADLLTIRLIVWARYINFVAIEYWSRLTFRHATPLGVAPLRIESARAHYAASGLPLPLHVPDRVPEERRLSLHYTLPYYGLTGVLFKLYRLWPIAHGTPWQASFDFNRAFPRTAEPWGNVLDDDEFTRLRLQGPNPFLLRRGTAPGEYVVDYSPHFKTIFDDVVCTFRLEQDRLVPASIRVGTTSHAPGTPGWQRAKLIANALDARYCVFTQHLLLTHLVVGQAFALAAYTLPPTHPLRSFLDCFTYGTLVVNDFAYKLLLTPVSYFLQSRFVTRDDATTIFQNSLTTFALEDLIVPADIAARGIDTIPHHPYVEDARDVWGVFVDFTSSYVAALYPDDAAIENDTLLQHWHARLRGLLPGTHVAPASLTSRQALGTLLCCLLYNNVVHEVCGDFSIFAQTDDLECRKLIDFERLKTGQLDAAPDVTDVFLFDQGAFAGRFNNGGNNLLTLPVDTTISDIRLRNAVAGLQTRLARLDRQMAARNAVRTVPFLRMLPRKWEASISF